jgi:potassium/hydrogen antiporter
MTEGSTVLIAGVLMAAALLASLLASRIRVPGLILFLGLGMLVGSDGLGWVEFDDYELARDIGIVALILIILEGGLTSGINRLRPVWPTVLSLATLGTLMTAVITGLAAALLFRFSLLESMLLGSIVASTDAAAIFGVLRFSSLRRKVARTLEGEAGSNDPVAVLLVLGFIEWIQVPDYGAVQMAADLVLTLTIGLLAGLALGWATVRAFKRLQLSTAGLYPAASISAAAVAYGLAELVGGSGFLAVYLVGLALGSADIPAKRTITAFHEGTGWIAQVVMFLALGLLVFPSQLPQVALEGTALGLVLAFVARPLAVFAVTSPFSLGVRERIVLSWAGLRGAVPVVLATFAVLAGVEHSLEFFNIVFFSVLISTLLQGATFEWVAERLRLTTAQPAVAPRLLEVGAIRRLGADVIEYEVRPDDAIVGARVRELGLPRGALVSVIERNGRALPPRGSTRIAAGDRLHVLGRSEHSLLLGEISHRWREGPVGRGPRSPRRFRGSPPIFSGRPWVSDRDGPADRPERIAGQAVHEVLRVREDEPAALVALADGRYALTGGTLLLGSSTQLQRWAAQRLRSSTGEGERTWLEQVIGALAAERNRGLSLPRDRPQLEGPDSPPVGEYSE